MTQRESFFYLGHLARTMELVKGEQTDVSEKSLSSSIY